MPNKKRSLIPRSVKVVPLAAASAVVFVALSMMGLLNFNPPGMNDPSTNDPTNDQNTEATNTEEAPVGIGNLDTEALVGVEAIQLEEPNFEPIPVVDIVVDGDEYLVATSKHGDQWMRETSTIEQLVEAAKNASGDGAGIKVRIARTFSATAQAEQAIVSALSAADIPADAIDQRRTLVE
ncbi:hypothetical protein Q31b_27480 [Novipirellula aureliae]|uniref:Uncharacterized protein n=1 Tax=Novipirellula aureliae TaxID=2527966 RepID=A0A5C6E2D3_9BACT|nr:hypothetical protein [Novipirellula aureliae]TWU41309.1 hypothetical protein Q31b_27480 [Novipirellula aureliae]